MNLAEFTKDFDAVVEFFKTDITGLRTGRASSAIVENVMVEAYGTHQPLKATASISVADAKTLNIEPWDKGLLGAIEKGLRDSGLGINPVNDGRLIRLSLPELTSERRQELVKVLHQRIEQAKISIRKVREDVREMIAQEEKDKSITEDDKYSLQEELEKMVKEYNETVKELGEAKEKDITTV
jgi:ribosome recycling factor